MEPTIIKLEDNVQITEKERQLLLYMGYYHSAEELTVMVRRSEREFDISFVTENRQAWLPLSLIRTFNWETLADMSDIPEMVREGDWSGIRDSSDDTIWKMFEKVKTDLAASDDDLDFPKGV